MANAIRSRNTDGPRIAFPYCARILGEAIEIQIFARVYYKGLLFEAPQYHRD